MYLKILVKISLFMTMAGSLVSAEDWGTENISDDHANNPVHASEHEADYYIPPVHQNQSEYSDQLPSWMQNNQDDQNPQDSDEIYDEPPQGRRQPSNNEGENIYIDPPTAPSGTSQEGDEPDNFTKQKIDRLFNTRTIHLLNEWAKNNSAREIERKKVNDTPGSNRDELRRLSILNQYWRDYLKGETGMDLNNPPDPKTMKALADARSRDNTKEFKIEKLAANKADFKMVKDYLIKDLVREVTPKAMSEEQRERYKESLDELKK